MSETPENEPQQPQPLDNPATAGGDLDPQSPRDAGAFQQQYDEPEPEPNGNPVGGNTGEPVVEPQPVEDEQRSTDGEVRIDVVEHDTDADDGAADDDAEDDGEPEPDQPPPAH